MSTTRQKLAGVATAAALFGGSAVGAAVLADGIAGAQESDGGGSADESTEATDPDAPGSGEESTDEAPRGAWVQDVLDDLVAEGVLDQEQADAVAEALAENRPERPFGPRHHPGPHLEIAAETIGVEPEELAEALRSGRSMAEVAEANGVDPQVVVDALVADAEEHLARAVENGRLDEDEVAEKLDEITERITDAVNGELEPRGPRGPHGPFRGDGDGPGGDEPPADDAEADTAAV